jgi:hypothetical protein
MAFIATHINIFEKGSLGETIVPRNISLLYGNQRVQDIRFISKVKNSTWHMKNPKSPGMKKNRSMKKNCSVKNTHLMEENISPVG